MADRTPRRRRMPPALLLLLVQCVLFALALLSSCATQQVQGQSLGPVQEHSLPIVGVVVDGDGYLYTATYNDGVRRWNFSSDDVTTTYTTESGTYLHSLAVGDGRVFAGADSGRVYAWARDNATMIWGVEGHTIGSFVRALCYGSGMLFSSATDQQVRKWALNGTHGHAMSVEDANGAQALAISGDILFVGSSAILTADYNIQQYNIVTGAYSGGTYAACQSSVTGIFVNGTSLYASCGSKVYRWMINSNFTLTKIYSTTPEANISSVHVAGGYVFGASSNIVRWNEKTAAAEPRMNTAAVNGWCFLMTPPLLPSPTISLIAQNSHVPGLPSQMTRQPRSWHNGEIFWSLLGKTTKYDTF